MKNTKEAFLWIVSLFKKNKIPFQLTGGFAAKVYGSKRKHYDIDFEIPGKYFKNILPEIKDYLVCKPRIYKSSSFQLPLITLKYKGENIDIADADNQKMFVKNKKKWVKTSTDLTDSSKKKIYGIIVPIEPKESLIEYKKAISRPEDIEDLKYLT